MLKSARLWMITDSSLCTTGDDEATTCQTLAGICSRTWTALAALILREKRWDYETVLSFWETVALKTGPVAEGLEEPPLRLLNWPMTYEPWTLPIDGLHLDAVAATTMLKHPEIYMQFRVNLESKKWLIGLSIHNYKEWTQWRVLKPDYILLSNIYETDCKVGKAGLGIVGATELLSKIKQDRPEIRIIGLGGLKRSDMLDMTAIGLDGIALRSELHKK